MNNRKIIGTSTVLLCQWAAAFAGDSPVQANVALTTDYVFRGISQTDSGPAIQGGFDASTGAFYAGVWASSVDFGDDTTMELDFYGGYSQDIGAVTVDFGAIYYAYPDSPELTTGSQDFVEVYAGVSGAVGAVDMGVSLAVSPEFYGETGEATYLQGTLGYSFTETVSGSLAYGMSEFGDDALNDDYQDVAVGVTTSVGIVDWTVQYIDTFDRVGGDDSAVILSVARSF